MRIPCRLVAVIAQLTMLFASAAPNEAATVRTAPVHRASVTLCPALPGGTGMLPDGDFSQAYVPAGSGDGQYGKGQTLAPSWTVVRRTINFVGPQFWNIAGLCSVDLYGIDVGAIVSAPFPTVASATYTLTFYLSGNGCCGGGDPPKVKRMKIRAAGQTARFRWKTGKHHDVEHGVWTQESWSFQATGSTTAIEFVSEDQPRTSTRGAVIAGMSLLLASP